MYIGQDLQVAFPSYTLIDDISGSFDGTATTFPLTVNGSTPVPLPINAQQCLISVDGVIQQPDPTGATGFNLVGNNIVFASAPAGADPFFGVILAGADYINVGAKFPAGSAAVPSVTFENNLNTGLFNSGTNQLSVTTAGTERFRFTSNGQNQSVSLGTNAEPAFSFTNDPNTGIYSPGADQVAISTNGVQRTTVDSSGRLLVGTSTPDTTYRVSATGYTPKVEFKGTDVYQLALNRTSDSCYMSIASKQTASSGVTVGGITFNQWDGSNLLNAASISVSVDGTPGANDMPGRLVFSTTADGASSPTERMRITESGDVTTTGTSTFSRVNPGFTARNGDSVSITRNAGRPFEINRGTDDGDLVAFFQANTLEGVISVSGSTVTYGGGHLARWSQLPNNEDPSNLLKGTVMSNLDEMCEWGEEDNEQLNRTKVSDVEGDPNVAGVFVSTSFDEDGPQDFFVAMTGDMIIRIAEGVTVQRGDLLMSAGDGTAKPQDDDIIRSKTVAKVTSTHVTCTYDDGSYCVPCVLMAC